MHRLQPRKRGYTSYKSFAILTIVKYQNNLMRYLTRILPLPSILAKTFRSLGAPRIHLLGALPNEIPKPSPPSFPRDARNEIVWQVVEGGGLLLPKIDNQPEGNWGLLLNSTEHRQVETN